MERVSVHKAKPAPSATNSAPSWLTRSHQFGVLQRKCGCAGSGPTFGGCEACKAERGARLQRASASRAESTAVPPIVHEVLRSPGDRKSTRLNSSHLVISYAVFCLKKKIKIMEIPPAQYNRTEKQIAHDNEPKHLVDLITLYFLPFIVELQIDIVLGCGITTPDMVQ